MILRGKAQGLLFFCRKTGHLNSILIIMLNFIFILQLRKGISLKHIEVMCYNSNGSNVKMGIMLEMGNYHTLFDHDKEIKYFDYSGEQN